MIEFAKKLALPLARPADISTVSEILEADNRRRVDVVGRSSARAAILWLRERQGESPVLGFSVRLKGFAPGRACAT